MATYRQRQSDSGSSEEIPRALEEQRRQVEQLAHTMSRQAQDQWRKAIEGLVALPAAFAVSTAASALYAVGFVARGFEVFQRTALDASAEYERGMRREGYEGREPREGREQREGREEERGRNEQLGRTELPRA
jgi:hypothetical protein